MGKVKQRHVALARLSLNRAEEQLARWRGTAGLVAPAGRQGSGLIAPPGSAGGYELAGAATCSTVADASRDSSGSGSADGSTSATPRRAPPTTAPAAKMPAGHPNAVS